MAVTKDREFLTLAAVRKNEDSGTTEYLFNEKQRIFTFRSPSKRAVLASKRLDQSFELKRPVLARLDEKEVSFDRYTRKGLKVSPNLQKRGLSLKSRSGLTELTFRKSTRRLSISWITT